MPTLICLFALGVGFADGRFEPPAGKRPVNFRDAIGLFRIQAGAKTTSVRVNQPIRYIIRITADSGVPMFGAPVRPEIEKDGEFTALFHVETPEPASKKDGNVWEFYYLLKPKSVSVTEIPELKFWFFNPRFGSDERGYQFDTTDPIAIAVTPALVVVPEVQHKADADNYPASVREAAETDEVLKHHYPWTPPSAGVLVVVLLTPPLAALGWLLVWRRIYPDAARMTALRRSRAAKDALKALQAVREPQQAERVANIVGQYLGHRFGLPAATPTPTETETHLRGAGLPDELRERTSALLQTCDALRFSAVPPSVSGSLANAAREVILALEEWTWSSLPS